MPHTPQHVSSYGAGIGTAESGSSDDESIAGGDSVLADHTNYASDVLKHAVERTSLHDVNPKIGEALESLRRLAQLQSLESISQGPRFPHQQRLPPGGLSQLQMPPLDTVVSLLRHVKGVVRHYKRQLRPVHTNVPFSLPSWYFRLHMPLCRY